MSARVDFHAVTGTADEEACALVERHIADQAKESAATLIEVGRHGLDPSDYELGCFPGDIEALEERMGRPADKAERLALEKAIRCELAKAAS